MKPSHDANAYLYDMLESAQMIIEYTKNLTFEDFMRSSVVRDAVVMRFAVIGEAVTKIDRETERRMKEIPFAQIRGFRNRIVHDYGRIDFSNVWKTIQDDIPPLVQILEEHLKK